MKLLATLFLLKIGLFSSFCYGQNKCDSSIVYEIMKKQIKKVDRLFDRNYFLIAETHRYEVSSPCKNVDAGSWLCCDQIMTWNGEKVHSKKGTLVSRKATGNMDYVAFVSMPVFSKNKRKCELHLKVHRSEWGGHWTMYAYKKVFGLWVLTKRQTYRTMG